MNWTSPAGAPHDQVVTPEITDTADDSCSRLQQRLQAFIGGDAGTVHALAPLEGGHAGQTYGFVLNRSGCSTERFVLKVAPAAVPLSGSTDIFRQDKLLRTLRSLDLPVPGVRWSSPDPEVLGTPFIVMEHLPGETYFPWGPGGRVPETPETARQRWFCTVEAMALFHSVDWADHLKGWHPPSTAQQELSRWSRLLKHMPQPHWQEWARYLAERLIKSTPADATTGLVHGDLQPGNVLIHMNRLEGVIDWDLAAIAPLGIDAGWLMMMADPSAWPDTWRPQGAPTQPELIRAYGEAGGPPLTDLPWFQALAHLKLVAITGLNLKLHRDGRRPDEAWEHFADCIPHLLIRASRLAI